MPCEHFTRFINNPGSKFTKVDTTNYTKVLKTSRLACQKLVDISGHYKVWGNKKDKDSLVGLAVNIIGPYYTDMKAECDKNKLAWHKSWEKRLDEYNLHFTDKEA
ncbi:hypothetical protein D1007_18960 [Hordeum vulgare]|nr:hypothetical protein D1007_18960 [Hordeum vulgare]